MMNVQTLERWNVRTLGLAVGIAVWLAQIAVETLATGSLLIGSPSLRAPGGALALVETFLLAGLIGALTASRARVGAVVAGGSYALTHFAPVLFQLAWTSAPAVIADAGVALGQQAVGVDPAFIGFIEHALLWATANELAFVAVALTGGVLGGALAGGLSRLTRRVVFTSEVQR